MIKFAVPISLFSMFLLVVSFMKRLLDIEKKRVKLLERVLYDAKLYEEREREMSEYVTGWIAAQSPDMLNKFREERYQYLEGLYGH